MEKAYIKADKEIAELKESLKIYSNTQTKTLDNQSSLIDKFNELKELFAKQQENIDYNFKFLTDHTIKLRDATIKDYNELKKASGGEKEVVDEQKLVMGEKGTQLATGCGFESHPSTFINSNATDSKPPEPCKHAFSTKGDFIICDLCGYIAHERPQKEPREDGYKDWSPTHDDYKIWNWYERKVKGLQEYGILVNPNELISEFVKDLNTIHYRKDIIKKWEEKLK